MRELVGLVFLAMAFAAVVLLVVGLLRPSLFGRFMSPAPGRGTLAALFGCGAAACFALGAAFVVVPHYSVAIAPDGQIVAEPGSAFVATVDNRGLLGGAYDSDFVLDEASPITLGADVDGSATSTVVLTLPDDLTPGEHTLTYAGQTIRFKALTPAKLKVGKLMVLPEMAKTGKEVQVSALVTNSGEADGEFPGEFKVNGKVETAEPKVVKGKQSLTVVYSFKRPRMAYYNVAVGKSKARVPIVKVSRPASGAILARDTSGNGHVTLTNKTKQDMIYLFTRTTSPKAEPVLAVYVRKGGTNEITGIADGSLWVYYTTGSGFNTLTDSFMEPTTHVRFKKPATFSTRHWTTTDYSARTITSWTGYTDFHITVSDKWVSGMKDGGVFVDADKFPGV